MSKYHVTCVTSENVENNKNRNSNTKKRILEKENVKRTQKTAKLSENEKIQQNHALTTKQKQIRARKTPQQQIKRLEVLKMYTKKSI